MYEPGQGSDRYAYVREAQQRFGGDAVGGDKFVFHLSSGRQSSPLRPLSPSLAEFARSAFVAPDDWEKVRLDFRERRTVLLRGSSGHGRPTMAIRLLQTVEAIVIYQLDPRIDLARMSERLAVGRVERGTAFLLCDPDEIGKLDAYTFQSLESALEAVDARLVVTVGTELSFRDDGLLRYQISLPAAPSKREILSRHLSHRLEDEVRAEQVLAQREVAELVDETVDRPGVTCEAVAVLAMLLARASDRAGDQVDVAWIRAQLLRRHIDEFDMWFDSLVDLELRCFAVALAVLNGLPLEDVADAARRLYRRLSDGGPITLDDDATLRVTDVDPFRITPARLLRTLQARVTQTEIRTPYGYAPAAVVSYRDPGYARRVIERVWQGYRIQDELLAWLEDLVGSPSDQVRVYAGTTVGALATLAFEFVRRRALHFWANSDLLSKREAVADALRVAAERPELAPAAQWLVDGWYRSREVELQCTAALALGTRLGRPDAAGAIRALERLLRRTDLWVRIGIGRGFTSLLIEDAEALVPLFYGVLERCLADPRRASSAQFVFLFVANDLLTEVRDAGGSVNRRPTLLSLAQDHEHLRRPLIRLWARALAGGNHVRLAEAVLRHWASYAESDEDTRDALARTVREVAALDPAAGSAARRLVRAWNSDEELVPMPYVARALGDVLPPEPVER